MMKNGNAIRCATMALALLGCLQPSPARAADPGFESWWRDGKAELDGYRLMERRYGHPRAGRGVMIFVTEPFLESARVKADDPANNPRDTFGAFKLNLVRDFQTGIYDYHTMLSLFTRDTDFSPVKVAFSSSEWCGQVYEEQVFRGDSISQMVRSYFEGEAHSASLPAAPGGIEEDNLFIVLRNLRLEFLGPGESRLIKFLPGPFARRLGHRGLEWQDARIERLPKTLTVRAAGQALPCDVYRVHCPGAREGEFRIERAYPHRVIEWSWKSPSKPAGPDEIQEHGTLTGTTRLDYWRTHDPGDERYLGTMGLKPGNGFEGR